MMANNFKFECKNLGELPYKVPNYQLITECYVLYNTEKCEYGYYNTYMYKEERVAHVYRTDYPIFLSEDGVKKALVYIGYNEQNVKSKRINTIYYDGPAKDLKKYFKKAYKKSWVVYKINNQTEETNAKRWMDYHKTTTEDCYRNRWVEYLKTTSTEKNIWDLEIIHNKTIYRSVFGNACHIFENEFNLEKQVDANLIHKCVKYNNCRMELPKVLQKALNITRNGDFKNPIIINGKSIKSLKEVNDKTILNMFEIANIMQENFNKDNFEEYK